MSRASCMGGMCPLRDKCALHVTDDRSKPIERLCSRGGAESYQPIAIVPGTREVSQTHARVAAQSA